MWFDLIGPIISYLIHIRIPIELQVHLHLN